MRILDVYRSKLRQPLVIYLFALLSLLTSHAFAEQKALDWFAGSSDAKAESLGDDTPIFLPVDEAFRLTAQQTPEGYHLQWIVEDGYYLYRQRFSFKSTDESTATVGEPKFARDGKIKDDPSFGEVEVYFHEISIDVPISVHGAGAVLEVRYQGCAEAGLCYPPKKVKFDLVKPEQGFTDAKPSSLQGATETSKPAQAAASSVDNESVDFQNADSFTQLLLEASLLETVFWLFLAGLGLAFTPCVLPMVPILSSIIVGQKEKLSATKGFFLSLCYVLGMAVTYAALGAIVSNFNIQPYFQIPAVIVVFASIFVVLSLAMFGLFELQLPAFLRDKVENLNQKQQGGTYFSVFIMGVLSTLVVSPCVSAPLAGVLLYVSSTGDPLLGSTALFAMGMGMGVPLLIIGTGGGQLLPKAGTWMIAIKSFFGVVLLGAAIWLLERILPGPVGVMLWAILIVISGIAMGALEAAQAGWSRFWKGVGLVLVIYGGILIYAASHGGQSVWLPMADIAPRHAAVAGDSAVNLHPFERVADEQELNQRIASAAAEGKGVMFDFYADWCTACIVMEKDAFVDPGVQRALENVVWLQIDVTDNNAEHQQLMKKYNVFGPPSILFFDTEGEEIRSARVIGEMHSEAFLNQINTKVLPKL